MGFEQFGPPAAVRRTAERPRLAAAAATITEHVRVRVDAVLDRPQPPEPAPGPSSTFEPTDVVEHAVAAAATAFGTTPDVLLGSDRTRVAADARAVAMTAARMHGRSLPTIARTFDREHTTVLHATRRIEKTPPLCELAAKIAADLPTDRPLAYGRGADAPEREQVRVLASRGAREQQRATGSHVDRPSCE